MSMSYFESRQGNLTTTPEKLFSFVTDMRNFKRFIPGGSVSNWTADRDSCSFSVNYVGSVNVRLDRKEEYKLVAWKGDAMKKEDFELILHIDPSANNTARVKVNLSADLNVMMKAVASKPIGQFLEMLVNEMERFNGWEEFSE